MKKEKLKMKKILSVMLVAILLLASLTACNDPNNKPETKATNYTSASAS